MTFKTDDVTRGRKHVEIDWPLLASLVVKGLMKTLTLFEKKTLGHLNMSLQVLCFVVVVKLRKNYTEMNVSVVWFKIGVHPEML